MTEHKYILEPYKGMNTRYRCPSCQQRDKTFSLYIDTDTGEHIHPSVGRCNRESKCGHHYTPKQYFQDNNISFDTKQKAVTPQPKPQTEPVFNVSHSVGSKIDLNKTLFTEISVYDASEKGIIQYLNLTDLQSRLNSFKKDGARKDTNPAILKGIYKNGTAGENCTMPVPFLFFDIDVKETENPELLDPARNNAVFELLKDIALLIWRSNSQKGIAGILFIPQFGQFKNENRDEHLKISKVIYKYLTDYIYDKVGFKVQFDPQQGKFRQIRYLAEQTRQRVLNECIYTFYVNKSEMQYIPVEVFKASLKGHEANHFVKFLINLFGVEVTNELISQYFIATSKHWNGATVFLQIDTQGKVRTGKIMLYSPSTGKRIKEPFNHISWVHKSLKQPEFELKQCLFGEHLLKDKTKPVAIVESEKTAVIASVYLPQFIWLAVGSLTNLNAEKCSILKGRTVTLFPDLNGFDKWSSKAKELSHLSHFAVSDLLECKATEAERQQGFDLADYLIKFDYKAFAIPETPQSAPAVQLLVEVKPIEQTEPVYHFSKTEQPMPESWEQDIIQLENYFTGLTLPTQPVKLKQAQTILSVSKFIESHFATLKANNGKRIFLPYLNRLQELKQVLNTNLN